PRERHGAARAADDRLQRIHARADHPPGVDHPVQLLVVPAAGSGGRRLRPGRPELPARRVLPDPRDRPRHRGARLDDAGRAGVGVQRLHHRDALDARRVRRTDPERRQRRAELPRDRAGGLGGVAASGTRVSRHFLVIGAQRCGTTWLAAQLEAQAGIAMAQPVRPEPKVFLRDLGPDEDLAWYERTWFAHATPDQVLGEKSTSYLDRPDAIPRVRAMLGGVPLVVQLRDPVA